MITDILIVVLVILAMEAVGFFLYRWYLRDRTRPSVKVGQKHCEVCLVALPANAVRTHHGRWRCAAHKSQAVG